MLVVVLVLPFLLAHLAQRLLVFCICSPTHAQLSYISARSRPSQVSRCSSASPEPRTGHRSFSTIRRDHDRHFSLGVSRSICSECVHIEFVSLVLSVRTLRAHAHLAPRSEADVSLRAPSVLLLSACGRCLLQVVPVSFCHVLVHGRLVLFRIHVAFPPRFLRSLDRGPSVDHS